MTVVESFNRPFPVMSHCSLYSSIPPYLGLGWVAEDEEPGKNHKLHREAHCTIGQSSLHSSSSTVTLWHCTLGKLPHFSSRRWNSMTVDKNNPGSFLITAGGGHSSDKSCGRAVEWTALNCLVYCTAFTKHPLLQESRFTGGGSPNVVDLVEWKSL